MALFIDTDPQDGACPLAHVWVHRYEGDFASLSFAEKLKEGRMITLEQEQADRLGEALKKRRALHMQIGESYTVV